MRVLSDDWMQHDFLDRYSEYKSVIHSRDPRVKILFVTIFILAVTSTRPTCIYCFVFYFCSILVLMLFSRIPLRHFALRSMVVVPFTLFVAVLLPFLASGETILSWRLAGFRLAITRGGLWAFFNVLAKSWLCVLALILLTSSTRFDRLLQGLQSLGFPRIMIILLSFLYRYLFLFWDETLRMMRSHASRYFGKGPLRQFRLLGNMIAVLFIRAYERGERIYAVMASRGFTGEIRTLSPLRFSSGDLLFLILSSVVLVGLRIYLGGR